MALTLRREILKQQGSLVQVLLELPGQRPLTVSCERIGHTAGMAAWIRNVVLADGRIVSGDLHAISLLLTGIDGAADAEAVSKVESMKVHAGKKLAFVEKFVAEARREVRPVAMTLCYNFEVSIDPLFVASTQMLVRTFSDQFGIER